MAGNLWKFMDEGENGGGGTLVKNFLEHAFHSFLLRSAHFQYIFDFLDSCQSSFVVHSLTGWAAHAPVILSSGMVVRFSPFNSFGLGFYVMINNFISFVAGKRVCDPKLTKREIGTD